MIRTNVEPMYNGLRPNSSGIVRRGVNTNPVLKTRRPVMACKYVQLRSCIIETIPGVYVDTVEPENKAFNFNFSTFIICWICPADLLEFNLVGSNTYGKFSSNRVMTNVNWLVGTKRITLSLRVNIELRVAGGFLDRIA